MIGLFVTFLQLIHSARRNADDNIIMTWESYQLQDKFSLLIPNLYKGISHS